jgi:two-component system phosphate regulon sensor histidine kinase PhoR
MAQGEEDVAQPAAMARAARYGVPACLAGLVLAAGLNAAGLIDRMAALAVAVALAGLAAFLFLLSRSGRDRAAARAANARIAAGRQAPALFQTLLESIPDPLLLLDSRGWVVDANPAAHRLFGARITDRALASVLRNPSLLDAVERAIADGAVAEVAFTLPVPVARHLRAVLSPLRSGDAGAPTPRGPVLLVLFRDLTAMHRLEAMRGDFVANVSHELRTPLSILSGFIETLRGPARDDPEARDRFLDIMEDQARRMARLIDDLLSLSRIEMDEHVRPTGQVDLVAAARTVTAALQPLADAAGVVLEVTLPESLPRAIGEHDQLVQVLQNLIDNAIKYGASGGRVTIEAGIPAAPGQVAVAVRDHGEGIARTHLPRLTERFYRIDDARSRARGGTGLGLAIVKHVVNRHNGRLVIDSEPGRGSVFTVSLPAASDPPAQS